LPNVVEQPTARLAAVVGSGSITFERPACSAFAIDGLVPRCVVYPGSGAHAAAALQYASDNGLAVVPCCNATKLSIGNIPRRYDVALCLKGLDQTRHYEPDDLTVSVEPGIRLGSFQEFLSRRGLWIPLDPPGGAGSTLGGIVATNASGPLRLRYGAPRDMVLGMKIATVEGKVIKTGGRVVKNVAGYDLAKLMIGSYGTLGVIVEINFKLYPLPSRRVTRAFRATNLSIARDFRRKVLDSPLSPSRMILLDPGGSAIVRAGAPLARPAEHYEIWIEFAGSEAVTHRSLTMIEGIAASAGLAGYPLEEGAADGGWSRLADFAAPGRRGPEDVLLKASLPLSRAEEFIGCSLREAGAAKVGHAACVQLGVGIVHLCLTPEERASELLAITGRIRQAAVQRGGSLTVLHCPAGMKKNMDVWGTEPDDFPLMQRLKETWDPNGTLSPGRFLGHL
jgi:glycolate oxidase FAD binding subunit